MELATRRVAYFDEKACSWSGTRPRGLRPDFTQPLSRSSSYKENLPRSVHLTMLRSEYHTCIMVLPARGTMWEKISFPRVYLQVSSLRVYFSHSGSDTHILPMLTRFPISLWVSRLTNWRFAYMWTRLMWSHYRMRCLIVDVHLKLQIFALDLLAWYHHVVAWSLVMCMRSNTTFSLH